MVVDANGVPMKPVEALEAFQNSLGGKVKAIRKEEWRDEHTTFPQVGDLAFDVVDLPAVKHFRAKVGKGVGPDGMQSQVVKGLPDKWLEGIPKCFENSFAALNVALADWNMQRMRPIPKISKSKLEAKYFRGIAISNVARALCATTLLHALGNYFTNHAPW
eukprot:3757798-Amphidinium_carterae.1